MAITYMVKVGKLATKWYLNGELHREDGPAVTTVEGDCWYMRNGLIHREDGPAVTYSFGTMFWFLDGEQLTEEEFNEKMYPAPEVEELTVAEIEKRLGYSIKVVK